MIRQSIRSIWVLHVDKLPNPLDRESGAFQVLFLLRRIRKNNDIRGDPESLVARPVYNCPIVNFQLPASQGLHEAQSAKGLFFAATWCPNIGTLDTDDEKRKTLPCAKAAGVE